jgi:hypothetical protein
VGGVGALLGIGIERTDLQSSPPHPGALPRGGGEGESISPEFKALPVCYPFHNTD